MNFPYKGIGFNGPHLAAMPFDQFSKEISHQLTEDEQKDLYSLLQIQYKGAVNSASTSYANDKDTIPEVGSAEHGSGDSEQPGTNKRRPGKS